MNNQILFIFLNLLDLSTIFEPLKKLLVKTLYNLTKITNIVLYLTYGKLKYAKNFIKNRGKMNKPKCLFLFIIILTLSSCIDKVNQLKYLPVINISDSFYQIQDDIALTARALSAVESKKHFGVDLTNHGYIPIQIKIENRTPDNYIIRPSYIDLTIADSCKIAKLLHWDTSTFVMTTGCLSLLFWWPATIWVGQTGYDMYKMNRSANENVKEISVHSNQAIEIPPYDILNKFIFINKADFKSRFTIKLFNSIKRQLVVFDINVFGHIKPKI